MNYFLLHNNKNHTEYYGGALISMVAIKQLIILIHNREINIYAQPPISYINRSEWLGF